MEKINIIQSSAVPLRMEHIDTDQIIPARYLKATSREGFGDNLFRDWRFDSKGEMKAEFPLNQELYKGAILVAGQNFGCGSSREHAAWAIHDYGFRVVISSKFADIFEANALNNGVLPITVSEEFLQTVFEKIESDPTTTFKVNLEQQKLMVGCWEFSFAINPFKKYLLMQGKTELDVLIETQGKIKEYESEKGLY